ncbi:MAG: hypothetical protein ACYC9Y_09730 [Candidatus Methylomirabilia bacterium]
MIRAFAFVVVEGALEVPASQRLLREVGVDTTDVPIFDKGGRVRFWKDVRRYNRAAEHAGLILGVADLEAFPCPSGLVARHVRGQLHKNFVLRIAERMLESWLLADTALAKFFGIDASLLPREPDQEANPKQTIVNLARRSASREIRSDVVPQEGSLGVVGRGYTPRMTEFIEEHWRPVVAARRSESLRRAMRAVREAVRQ